jgi:hypothetical protein
LQIEFRREADRKLPIAFTTCSPSPLANALPKMPSEENKVSAFAFEVARRDADFRLLGFEFQERIIRVVEFGRVRQHPLPDCPHSHQTEPTGCSPLRMDPIHYLRWVHTE